MTLIKNRNFGLDVIRFIAILLVLLQHGGFPLLPGLQGLKIGGFGVEIFFVLSGYLIGGILIKNLEKDNSFHSIWHFWVRRWFRILPVYYLLLAIKFIFFDGTIGGNILYYVFFLQNNFYGISFYDVTWSLVIEEWFYLLAPIYIAIVFKLFRKVKTRMYSFIAFLFFILTIRIFYVVLFDVPYTGVNGNVPFRLDSLFIGVLLMYFKLHFHKFYIKLTQLWVFILALIVLFSYLLFISYLPSFETSIDSIFFTRTLGFSMVSIFAALLIPYCVENVRLNAKNLISKIVFNLITYTSLFTYAIYLIHPLVFPYFIHNNPYSEIRIINFLIAILVTFFLAAVVYYGYESKWLKIRDRFYIRKK